MRLSLAFAIIAGIVALDRLEVSVNRDPVVEAFNGAPGMSRPGMPGMMPSASLQLATQPLEKLPMFSRHGTSPLLVQAASSSYGVEQLLPFFMTMFVIDSRSKIVG